ncbi:MAG: M28 family peptidase [Flavobacteriales bacterium]|nr:M28 family peptidase [Flavobacteriales bacterium]
MKFILLIIFSSVLNRSGFANNQVDTSQIKNHLIAITKTNGYRNYKNVELLNNTADYIFNHFQKYADTVYFQEYIVDKITYKNVICSFGIEKLKTIVVGAHYDVCGNQEGADDNASGIVGLLQLAKELSGKELNHKIELVAYTIEEPPYFRTEFMGSYVHAKSLIDNNVDVYGMVSLEMIGYFKEEKRTQSYPLGILSLFYGNRGNYITLVNKFGKGSFARRFSKEFKKTKIINTKKFTGPKSLPGIDFSDHLNYWKFGFSSLMITDTAFYRNKNYHEKTDVLESLDFSKMGLVIDGVLKSLLELK